MITDAAEELSPARVRFALAVLLSIVFLAVLVRTAWVSDDALISLRTVLNVTHGYGLRFNIDERVQTFTHPLWLLLLICGYYLTGHLYLATFLVSMVCSLLVFWLAIRRAATPAQAAFAAVALLFSRAFVDFATSGLENPLLCLGVLLLVGVFLNESMERRRWLTVQWFLVAMLYLTRPDGVLFAIPLLAIATWRIRREAVASAAAGDGGRPRYLWALARAFLLGTLPASLWTAFSLLYYGFPFPNTAYAKLAMGLPARDLWLQGSLYLADSLDRDPISLIVVAFAVIFAFVQRRAPARALAAGILLYVVYVVSIGGDFMAGRFVSVPLYVAVIVLSSLTTGPQLSFWMPATAIAAVVGTAGMGAPVWSNSKRTETWEKSAGITDERAYYFRAKSIAFADRVTFRDPEWPGGGKRPYFPPRIMNACGLMGTAGMDYGPYPHLLDECALADPLLARLPAVYNHAWRIGHYRRAVPGGYRESLIYDNNQLGDPRLREFYDHVRTLVRSERLWSIDRLRTIAAMNFGRYDHLIDKTFYRFEGSVTTIDKVGDLKAEATPWNAEGNHPLAKPLAILVPDKRGRRYFSVSLDSDDAYLVSFLKGAETVSTVDMGPIPEFRRKPGLHIYTPDVPPAARARGFDTIRVAAVSGNNEYAMGHLIVEGYPRTDGVLYERVAERDGLVRR